MDKLRPKAICVTTLLSAPSSSTIAWKCPASSASTRPGVCAVTEVVRMAASDVLLGVAYDPEELGAEVEVVSPIGDISEPEVDVETGEIVEAEVVEP